MTISISPPDEDIRLYVGNTGSMVISTSLDSLAYPEYNGTLYSFVSGWLIIDGGG